MMDADKDLRDRFIKLSSPLEPIQTNTEPVLKQLRDIHVVMYDFYGTLFISGVGDIGIDDGVSDSTLLLEALKNSGIEIKSEKAGNRGFEIYNSVVTGEMKRLEKRGILYPEPDIRKIWKFVLDRMYAEELIAGQVTKEDCSLVSVEFEARMNPVWPMPGALEILTFFKEAGKLQGILSNSQFYTPIVLETLMKRSLTELGFHSGLLHWSFEEKRKKPGLNFYKSFLKKLNTVNSSVKPEQVLYVGNDMLKDVYPANEMGMKTALFAGDQRSLKWRKDDSRCKNIKPDIVITKMLQLKECIS